MYSHEDRIRAVEPPHQARKRAIATNRQLDYPTLNALKERYRECQQRRYSSAAGYALRKPTFCQAQKAAAIKQYLSHYRCIAAM